MILTVEVLSDTVEPTVPLSTLEVMYWLVIIHSMDSGIRISIVDAKRLVLPYQSEQQWLNPLVITGTLSLTVLF